MAGGGEVAIGARSPHLTYYGHTKPSVHRGLLVRQLMWHVRHNNILMAKRHLYEGALRGANFDEEKTKIGWDASHDDIKKATGLLRRLRIAADVQTKKENADAAKNDHKSELEKGKVRARTRRLSLTIAGSH